jgi:hypothetical protein
VGGGRGTAAATPRRVECRHFGFGSFADNSRLPAEIDNGYFPVGLWRQTRTTRFSALSHPRSTLRPYFSLLSARRCRLSLHGDSPSYPDPCFLACTCLHRQLLGVETRYADLPESKQETLSLDW